MATNNLFGNYTPPAPPPVEETVNVYVGMFFDGTGNNRFNSEETYYSHVTSSEVNIVADTIPSKYEVIREENGEEEKIKITDRDSYWNPYSNVVKLFDLYKEVKTKNYSDDQHPEYGKHVILKQYIEGIGTKQGKEDDILGSALGRSSWGVIGRVEEGIKAVVANQFSTVQGQKINKIVFDVFGFSRGAAAARHFCNEVKKKPIYTNMMRDEMDIKRGVPPQKYITKQAGGLLGAELKKKGHKTVGDTFNIEIRFLGLFDTVISDGITKENLGYKASLVFGVSTIIFQEALQDIKTNISNLDIKSVFHIKADNEWRKNFASTPTNAGYTLGMLGAHSDIGGGYASLDKNVTILDFFDLREGDTALWEEKQKVRQYFINSGFCTDSQIVLKNTHDHYMQTTATPLVDKYLPIFVTKEVERTGDYQIPESTIYDPTKTHIINEKKLSDHYMLVDERKISNKYSLVPMYLMLQKAIEDGVPFYESYDAAETKPPYKFEYEIPNTEKYKLLNEYLEFMKEVVKNKSNGKYTIPGEIYRHVLNNYVHLSANYGGLEAINLKSGDHHILGKLGFVNQPVPYTMSDGTIKYEREIYQPK